MKNKEHKKSFNTAKKKALRLQSDLRIFKAPTKESTNCSVPKFSTRSTVLNSRKKKLWSFLLNQKPTKPEKSESTKTGLTLWVLTRFLSTT